MMVVAVDGGWWMGDVVVVVVVVVGEYKLPIRSSDSDASLPAGASHFLPSPQSVGLPRASKQAAPHPQMPCLGLQNFFYSRCCILFYFTLFYLLQLLSVLISRIS
jgi:hypothetical protein